MPSWSACTACGEPGVRSAGKIEDLGKPFAHKESGHPRRPCAALADNNDGRGFVCWEIVKPFRNLFHRDVDHAGDGTEGRKLKGLAHVEQKWCRFHGKHLRKLSGCDIRVLHITASIVSVRAGAGA